jgi:SAM-dependent methyltransferase
MAKLHFGAFNCPRDGWVNTDVTPHLRIARVPGLAWALHKLNGISDGRYAEHRAGIFKRLKYLNVACPWPTSSDTFDAIYSSHVLEHLPLRGAKVCLAESFRCLKKGGILRISVPDLDKQIADYKPENAADWAVNLFEANETSEKNMHHYMYNYHSLSSMMHEAGFKIVMRRGFREGECPDVGDLDNRPESLFVEALK